MKTKTLGGHLGKTVKTELSRITNLLKGMISWYNTIPLEEYKAWDMYISCRYTISSIPAFHYSEFRYPSKTK
jgi:hypothetical protein